MASKDLFKVKDIPMTTVGGSNYDDVSDYSVRKVIYSQEGTITKVPANDFDIANKKYVDDQLIVPGQSTTILNSGASTYKISGAILFASGSNIAITQAGQQLKWDVIGVPTGSGTSTGTNTGDQTIYATTLNISGSAIISGAVILQSGANIDLDQTAQAIKINVVGVPTGSGTSSGANTGDQTIYATTLNASGAAVISGAVVFASGANIDIVQTGQQIKIIGSAPAAAMTLLNSTTITGTATESYTLSGIAAGYKSFLVQCVIKQNAANSDFYARLDNISTGHYRTTYLENNGGSTAFAGSQNGGTSMLHSGNTVAFDTNDFGLLTLYISNSANEGAKNMWSIKTRAPGALQTLITTCSISSANIELSRIDLFADATKKWASGSNICVWGLT